MRDYLPLADQINILFEAITRADGRPYAMQEVAENIDVSLATISQLRNGKIKNPQLNTLRELCRFFDVPLRYFETTQPEECYALIANKGDLKVPQLNEIAFRALKLSPQSQRDVLNIIKWAQAAELEKLLDDEFPALPSLEDDYGG
ncbi:MAG: helix-turn-helix transcriptional regulator [Aggregatilineales bacterium]